MQYARETIDLMSAYPGRDFRIIEVVRYVGQGRSLTRRQVQAIKKGVYRVLMQLRESGHVQSRPPKTSKGGHAVYSWKVGHEVLAK